MKKFVFVLIAMLVPSVASAQDDWERDVQKGLQIADQIIDLIDKGSNVNPGGSGGGGGGYVQPLSAPNGVLLYPGQSTTIPGLGFYIKYWRCNNPNCYKLHSKKYGQGNPHVNPITPPPPPVLRYVIGITTQSVGTGVQVQSFTRNHNRGVLKVGDIIRSAQLPNGQQVQIRTHDQLTRAKDIAGPTGTMSVLVWSPYTNSQSWRTLNLNSGAGPGGIQYHHNQGGMVGPGTGSGVEHEPQLTPPQTGQGVPTNGNGQAESTSGDYGIFR